MVPITGSAQVDHTLYPDGQVEEGTYGGTQLALTEMFERIGRSYQSFFDVLAIEPTIPQAIPFHEKGNMYRFSNGDDGFPPHLDVIPKKEQVSQYTLFSALALVQTKLLVQKIIPSKSITGRFADDLKARAINAERDAIAGAPYRGNTIADIEKLNRSDRKTGTDVMRGLNIGDLPDWYSDARFAQQQFTGTNPTTITLASSDWLSKFKSAAEKQSKTDVLELLSSADPKSMYVQDCSYFRDAVKVGPTEILRSDGDEGDRFCCAAVSLFQLHEDGKFHPVAVVIDYKGSMDASVTIFNKRLIPSVPTDSEATDWAWRYAKTCAQVSDWIRHEVAIHLVHTHMIEEVVIVSTHRCIPETHPVFRLLSPHSLRTLSLNAGARETLVPAIIFDLIGIEGQQPFDFVQHAFKTFNFVGGYIPNDLSRRGFPLEELDTPKFKNYAYARNMAQMWLLLRTFVASMLALAYETDKQVAEDKPIEAWYKEIQTMGQIPTFPTIRTLDDLTDAVTMCIHIASPQHTAVNYLQNFYQAFVIAKPAALCSAPPTKLSVLEAFTEKDLVAALPINRPREWLLSAQVPWLLSYRVADENNLINYARSVWTLYKKKTGHEEQQVKAISNIFYNDLRNLIIKFNQHSRDMDEGTIPYTVMDPSSTAVSILI
ncbi:hypothetical protein LTR50_004755 [Elasticomyces elasticus]|nr:hypothetical protein LTR50_004755 [Elasticomyces elasticus]